VQGLDHQIRYGTAYGAMRDIAGNIFDGILRLGKIMDDHLEIAGECGHEGVGELDQCLENQIVGCVMGHDVSKSIAVIVLVYYKLCWLCQLKFV
jgi:hypothetical protein